MEANIGLVYEKLEADYAILNENFNHLEAENNHLTERINVLEKALEKQKKFHRKYADDVAETEALRLEDFKNERRALVEENGSLRKENRQLKKDLEFIKTAHNELVKEEKGNAAVAGRKSTEQSQQPSPPTRRSTRRLSSGKTNSHQIDPIVCPSTHTSSKVLSRVNSKLFEDLKKSKSKISTLNATVAVLKKKNQQLENFRKGIENKKTKFSGDFEELQQLVAMTQKKTKNTYNPSVLSMLRDLVQK